MNGMTRIRLLVLALATSALVQAGCHFDPVERAASDRAANLRPSVRFTGGAVTPDPGGGGHQVRLSWAGSDADGVIGYYQWAVDEAGATEPSLDRGRNFIVLAATGGACQPVVRVSETSLGSFGFMDDGDVWAIDVPAGVPLRFAWSGDAGHYGSRPGKVNYALDIPDPADESLQDPNGIGGWIGWGFRDAVQSPFTFTAEQGGTTHALYILMRDISEERSSTRRCTVRMKVVAFPFSRTALVVHDMRGPNWIPDHRYEDFLDRSILLRLRSLGDVDDFVFWRDWPTGGSYYVPLRLEDVTDYQAVVWSLGLAENIRSGLDDPRNDAVLSAYLKAGGRLFMFGSPIAGLSRSDFAYPLDPPTTDWDQAQLYFKFLYMRNEVVSNTMASPSACLAAKSGLVVARSAHPAYPDIFIDEAKRDPWEIVDGEYRGGISWEGTMAVPGQTPIDHEGLDTLYAVQTWNRSIRSQCGTDPSSVEGAIIGACYQSTAADTLEGRQHGRVVWFDFQPWWFQEDRLTDAGTAVVNWLFTGREQ